MSFVQVPPDSTGKKIATIENGSGEQVQIVALDSGTEVSLTGAVPLPTGAATEATLSNINTHFKTYAEAHSTADKGMPALVLRDDAQYGLINTDNTGAVKTQLPTNAATETTLAAISALQAQIASLADGIQYLANAIGASMPRLDAAGRQVVNAETGVVSVSGTLTGVTTVTTVATVSNISTIGGMNTIYSYQDVPTTIYDNVRVS